MEINESGFSYEFDAPKYFDFLHPEQSAAQWNDSWFGSASPEASRNNRLRLRSRGPVLPGPSRPLAIKTTTTATTVPSTSTTTFQPPTTQPTSTQRDIFAALASTKQRSATLQQQPTPSVPQHSIHQGRYTRPIEAPVFGSIRQTRVADGERDVAAAIKRITERFAKKPTLSTRGSIFEGANENEDKQQPSQGNDDTMLENTNDNNKENVPPHERSLSPQELEQQQSLSPSVSPIRQQEESQLLSNDWLQPVSSNLNNEDEDDEEHSPFIQERDQDLLEQHEELVEEEEQVVLLDEEEMEKNDTIFSGRSLGDEIAMAIKKQPPLSSNTNMSSAGTRQSLYENDDEENLLVDARTQKEPLSRNDNQQSLFDEMMERMGEFRQALNTQSSTLGDKSIPPSLIQNTVSNEKDQVPENAVYMEERQSLFETKKDAREVEEENNEEEMELSSRQQRQHHVDDQRANRSLLKSIGKEVVSPSVNKTRFDRRPQRPIASRPISKDQPLPTTNTTAPIDNVSFKEKDKTRAKQQDSTRMRRWLDDLPSQTSTTSNSVTTSPFLAPEKSRSVLPPRTSSSTKLQQPAKTTTTTNFDVLFQRMAKIRSELLQVAKTSAIKPAESDLIRNIEKLEGPITGKTGDDGEQLILSDGAMIAQRIARARKVIEESRRDSQLWFINNENQRSASFVLPSPASLKRKNDVALEQQHHDNDYHAMRSSSSTLPSAISRPNKIHRSLGTYSQDIIQQATTRRESMQHDISIAERVEKLKQKALRRASRVSVVPYYLPIEPTVPKSPTFATDARSRLSTNSRTYHY